MSLDANLEAVPRAVKTTTINLQTDSGMTPGLWENYGGTVRNVDVDITRPRSTEEVSRIVAAAGDRKIRPVATGHSWTAATKTDDVLMDVTGLDQILHIGEPRKDGTALVTAQAGVRLNDLCSALQARGLTMQNLGSMGFQTIGGATATNTHGSGRNHGGIATQVVRLKMLTGGGKIVSLSRKENPELFRAALSGLGLSGVVTEVTYKAVPAFNIGVSRGHRTLSHMVQKEAGQSNLQKMLHDNEWFSILWVPYTDRVFYSKGNRSEAPAEKPGAKWMESFSRNCVMTTLANVASATRRVAPRLWPVSERRSGVW